MTVCDEGSRSLALNPFKAPRFFGTCVLASGAIDLLGFTTTGCSRATSVTLAYVFSSLVRWTPLSWVTSLHLTPHTVRQDLGEAGLTFAEDCWFWGPPDARLHHLDLLLAGVQLPLPLEGVLGASPDDRDGHGAHRGALRGFKPLGSLSSHQVC